MLLDGWNISFGIYIPARDCESVDSLHDKRKVLECRDRRRQLAHTQTPIVTSAIRIRFIRLHRTRLPYLVCTKTFSLNVSLSLPIAFIV
jgi:hypothetical protein